MLPYSRCNYGGGSCLRSAESLNACRRRHDGGERESLAATDRQAGSLDSAVAGMTKLESLQQRRMLGGHALSIRHPRGKRGSRRTVHPASGRDPPTPLTFFHIIYHRTIDIGTEVFYIRSRWSGQEGRCRQRFSIAGSMGGACRVGIIRTLAFRDASSVSLGTTAQAPSVAA